MKMLYLMQGVPGSGKSTIANVLADRYAGTVLSTDSYRYRDGTYEYSPETNAEFHRKCQKACVEEMQFGTEVIFIDNTNITRWQAEPYIQLARIYDYAVQAIRVDVDVEVAIERQLDRSEDRRVPEHVIRSMHEQMEDLL